MVRSLGKLDRQLRALLSLVRHLRTDRRILGIVLVGSMASHEADALSDLDLWVLVDRDAYGAFWRAREALLRRTVAAVYMASDSSRRHQVGIVRAIALSGLVIEIGFFTTTSGVKIAAPRTVILDRGKALSSVLGSGPATSGRPRLLPGGRDAVPFALDDITKLWVRGHRRAAIRRIRELARTLARSEV